MCIVREKDWPEWDVGAIYLLQDWSFLMVVKV
jgi:hypothetical protein